MLTRRIGHLASQLRQLPSAAPSAGGRRTYWTGPAPRQTGETAHHIKYPPQWFDHACKAVLVGDFAPSGIYRHVGTCPMGRRRVQRIAPLPSMKQPVIEARPEPTGPDWVYQDFGGALVPERIPKGAESEALTLSLAFTVIFGGAASGADCLAWATNIGRFGDRLAIQEGQDIDAAHIRGQLEQAGLTHVANSYPDAIAAAKTLSEGHLIWVVSGPTDVHAVRIHADGSASHKAGMHLPTHVDANNIPLGPAHPPEVANFSAVEHGQDVPEYPNPLGYFWLPERLVADAPGGSITQQMAAVFGESIDDRSGNDWVDLLTGRHTAETPATGWQCRPHR